MTEETLTRVRRQTSTKLRGLERPEAFDTATIASEARLLAVRARRRTPAQKRDLDRIRRQAAGIEKLEEPETDVDA